MAIHVGSDSWVALGLEATFGTEVAKTDFIQIQSFAPKWDTPWAERPKISLLGRPGALRGVRTGAGDFTLDWVYEGPEALLLYCLGKHTFTSEGGPSSKWEFTPGTNYARKGLSIESCFGGDSHDWLGCKINQLAFTHSKDAVLQATASMLAQSWAEEAAPSTPSLPTDNPLLESHFTFKAAEYGVGLSAETNIDTFNLTLSYPYQTGRAKLGQFSQGEMVRNGPLTLSGSWSGDFLDNTYENARDSGTAYAIQAIWDSGVTIGIGPNNFKMIIDLPKIQLTGETPGVGDAAVVPETKNFTAVYDSTAGYAVKVTMYNEKSDYP